MSVGPDQLPETIEELLVWIQRQSQNMTTDAGLRMAAAAKIAALLLRESLVPTVRGLSQELADTRTVLVDASKASERYARALARATWGLVGATVVLVLATVACLIWG
jgi:hypothetical protein